MIFFIFIKEQFILKFRIFFLQLCKLTVKFNCILWNNVFILTQKYQVLKHIHLYFFNESPLSPLVGLLGQAGDQTESV